MATSATEERINQRREKAYGIMNTASRTQMLSPPFTTTHAPELRKEGWTPISVVRAMESTSRMACSRPEPQRATTLKMGDWLLPWPEHEPARQGCSRIWETILVF